MDWAPFNVLPNLTYGVTFMNTDHPEVLEFLESSEAAVSRQGVDRLKYLSKQGDYEAMCEVLRYAIRHGDEPLAQELWQDVWREIRALRKAIGQFPGCHPDGFRNMMALSRFNILDHYLVQLLAEDYGT